RQRSGDAAAELHDKGIGVWFDQVGVDHRQIVKVFGISSRQIANDSGRPIPIEIKAEVTVFGLWRQIEGGVVGETGGEMEIGTGINLQVAKGRYTSINLCAVGKLPDISDTFEIRYREPRHIQHGRHEI